MAGTFAQHAVDTGAEAVQDLKGNKCLDGTGKATAVDTVSTLALQVMLAHSQCQRHILVCWVKVPAMC